MAWLLVWGTSYARVWGWANFLHLCDIAVILTFVGLWRGSSLLISMQALSSIVPAAASPRRSFRAERMSRSSGLE